MRSATNLVEVAEYTAREPVVVDGIEVTEYDRAYALDDVTQELLIESLRQIRRAHAAGMCAGFDEGYDQGRRDGLFAGLAVAAVSVAIYIAGWCVFH